MPIWAKSATGASSNDYEVFLSRVCMHYAMRRASLRPLHKLYLFP